MEIVRYATIIDFQIQFNMENNTFRVTVITSWLDFSSVFTSELMYNSAYDILDVVVFETSPHDFTPIMMTQHDRG